MCTVNMYVRCVSVTLPTQGITLDKNTGTVQGINMNKHRWRDGRIVPSAEKRLQGATIPNHFFCDRSGRDFAQSSSIQTISEGSSGREGKGGRIGRTKPLAWGGNVDED